MKLYKFLKKDLTSTYQDFVWDLPKKNHAGIWTPGKWMPAVTGKLELCKKGYHLTDASHLLDWAEAQLFEAEYRGRILKGNNKFVVREARLLRQIEGWNDRNLRLFAVESARDALILIPDPDPRSLAACDIAERFANGKATKDELGGAVSAVSAVSAAYAASAVSAAYAASYYAVSAAYAAAYASAVSAAFAAASYAAYAASASSASHAAYAFSAVSAASYATASIRDAQYKKLWKMIGIGIEVNDD